MKESRKPEYADISRRELTKLKNEEQIFLIQLCTYLPGIGMLDFVFPDRTENDENGEYSDRELLSAVLCLRAGADYLYRGWMMLANQFSDPQFLNMVRRGISGNGRKDLLHLQKYFSDKNNSISKLLGKFPFDSVPDIIKMRSGIIKKGDPVIRVYFPEEGFSQLETAPVYRGLCVDSESGEPAETFADCLNMTLQVKAWLNSLITECIQLFMRRMNVKAGEDVFSLSGEGGI